MAVKRGRPQTRTYSEKIVVQFRIFERQKQIVVQEPVTLRSLALRPSSVEKLQFYYRPGTSDDSVLHEILDTHWYRQAKMGFDVLPGEHWLDLGANIGGFALYCWLHFATCTCYEPQPDNFALLDKNFRHVPGYKLHKSAVTHHNCRTAPFYRGRSPTDFARYTTDPTIYPVQQIKRLGSSPATEQTEVANIWAGLSCFTSPKKIWDGVKVDIEAAEHGILDAGLIPKCKKLVLEYHIRKDPSMANFRRRMAVLRKHFKTVHYAPSLDKGYPGDKYPGAFDRMIFCMDPK